MNDRVNPALIKMARDMLEGNLAEALEQANDLNKEGFVPVNAIKAGQGMMPPGAPMPPTPPGAPGAPMPPAGPTPAMPPAPPGGGGMMPPDPSMGGGMPPVDPNTGMPMDPSMMGGAPPGGGGAGQPIQLNLEDLIQLFSQIAEQSGGGGGGAPEEEGMEGPNEGSEPATTNKQLGQRIDALDEKIDMLLSALGAPPSGGELGPESVAGAGGEEIPPELLAAMEGGQLPPDAMAGGAPMDAMGGALPPEAVASAPMPMVPGGGGMGGMPVSASDDKTGMAKSATSISKLVAGLRRR